MDSNFLNNLTQEEKDFNLKIFDLILGRVFKKVYLDLDEEARKNMEKVFLSGSEKEKEKFIKNSMPDFDKTFKEESGKIQKEIEEEIEKQI